jgi:GMP synthase (glutamine-hydrolysing)
MTERRSVVAIRHVAFEDLGLIAGLLDPDAFDVAYCEAATDDLSHRSIRAADLVIVLGGPIGVGDARLYGFLSEEIALIESRLTRGKPTLGICLGAQLMAAALGERVHAGPVKEIGWGSVSLTPDGMRSALAPLGGFDAQVLHWHGDTFDLPRNARRLAFNEHYDNQAFALGRNALALQFHLEADARQLEEWYVGHTVELLAAGIDINRLREASRANSAPAQHLARGVFGEWLAGLFPEEMLRGASVHAHSA